jgi:hypothetical protein
MDTQTAFIKRRFKMQTQFKPAPARKYSGRILKLSDYLAAVPAPPEKVYYEYKIKTPWGVDANDTVGDCTCACIAHMIMLATAHTNTLVVPTTDQVLAVYSAITGYDPSQTQPDGSNPTDNGANIADVLNYWQNTGMPAGAGVHKITAWVQIDQTNLIEVKQALWLFGGVDLGINVYQSMMDQTNAKTAWDDPSGSILGGHSVPIFGFGSEGCTCVTWGALQQMGWACFETICDEAYCVITPDWINQLTGKAYSGFDVATLEADAAAIKQ